MLDDSSTFICAGFLEYGSIGMLVCLCSRNFSVEESRREDGRLDQTPDAAPLHVTQSQQAETQQTQAWRENQRIILERQRENQRMSIRIELRLEFV